MANKKKGPINALRKRKITKAEKQKQRELVHLRRHVEALRDIEQGQNRLVSWSSDEPPSADNIDYEVENNETPAELSDDDEHNYLWVYEPSDLDDLSIKEVKQVWDSRLKLCGSVEAAAEALAILEIDSGITDNYHGWQKYISHESLAELKAYLTKQTAPEVIDPTPSSSAIKQTTPQPEPLTSADIYSNKDIENLPIEAVKAIWDNREKSFTKISAACTALARLRNQSGIDRVQKHWTAFLDHEEIEKLDNLIEDDDQHSASVSAPIEKQHYHNEDAITEDRRLKDMRSTVVRVGQGKFRKLVLKNYSDKCCLSGCTEASLLEAAHINPYTGPHSNIIENSLCLRVDLHRLFDKLLISINPTTYKAILSKTITDDYYKSLEGKLIIAHPNPLFTKMLNRHYKTFVKVEAGRAVKGYSSNDQL